MDIAFPLVVGFRDYGLGLGLPKGPVRVHIRDPLVA